MVLVFTAASSALIIARGCRRRWEVAESRRRRRRGRNIGVMVRREQDNEKVREKKDGMRSERLG